ncbi:hypothetical protein [Flavobacterium sp.]|uniref:hypothetical protein n=1 Tax=Flavobacterium sp. TaxID=239 RepID=UPI003C5F84C9
MATNSNFINPIKSLYKLNFHTKIEAEIEVIAIQKSALMEIKRTEGAFRNGEKRR